MSLIFKKYLNKEIFKEDTATEATLRKQKGRLREEEFINILKQNKKILKFSLTNSKGEIVKEVNICNVEENDNSSGFIFTKGQGSKSEAVKIDPSKTQDQSFKIEIRNEKFGKFAEFERVKSSSGGKFVKIDMPLRSGGNLKFYIKLLSTGQEENEGSVQNAQ